MGTGRRRARGTDGAKLALLERFSSQMLATARRYSANLDDAEDAYQRAAEILLTQAPDRPADDMCRWLRTTVKHEAIAIRRQRERLVPLGPPELVPEPQGGGPDTHERVERFERLRIGAQALRRLKPQEVRCLLLKAEGYTYKEICEATGFSYTKVDRCLKEGRRAFTARLAGIEAGEECERVAPLLSALADGEATSEQLAEARPHLRTCLSCRATLLEYRAAPARVAALVPPAALAAGGGGGDGLRAFAESVAGAAQDRVAALGDRAHQAAELAAGQKVAAVAASAAALAGGGAASVDGLAGRPVEAAPQIQPALTPRRSEPPAPPVVAVPPEPPVAPGAAAAPQPQAVREEPGPPPEFAPDASAAATSAPAGGEFSPSGPVASGRAGEFGP